MVRGSGSERTYLLLRPPLFVVGVDRDFLALMLNLVVELAYDDTVAISTTSFRVHANGTFELLYAVED